MTPSIAMTSPSLRPSPVLVIDDDDDGLACATTETLTSPNNLVVLRPPVSDVPQQEFFTWSDFPILTEEIVYVDSTRRQQHRVELGKLEQGPNNDENNMFSSNGATVTIKSKTNTGSKSVRANKATSTSTVTSPRRKQRSSIARNRKVHFDAVHIREHSVTVGDHEWCEGTLAVSLDWPHTTKPKSMLIGDYEQLRERQGRVPRGRLPKLAHWQRKQLLKRVGGFSEQDIDQIDAAEMQRHSSMDGGHHSYAGLSRTKTVPNLFVELEPDE